VAVGCATAGEDQPTRAYDGADATDATDKTRTTDNGARPAGVPADAQQVRVSLHTDGDTVRVVPTGAGVLTRDVELKVRLLEIDAPESVAPGTPVECFALAASKRLARLLPIGSTAWAQPDRDRLDPYDRTLLYLWNDDGTFVNLAMVRDGYATAVLYPPNDLHIDELRAAEALAREAGRGLWGRCI
jgi:micrococcal nuclease